MHGGGALSALMDESHGAVSHEGLAKLTPMAHWDALASSSTSIGDDERACSTVSLSCGRVWAARSSSANVLLSTSSMS